MLENHADVSPPLADLAVAKLVKLPPVFSVPDQLAVHGQPAGVDLFEVVDAAQESRLSRAGRADDAHDLAGTDLEGDAPQNLLAAETLAYALRIDHHLSH